MFPVLLTLLEGSSFFGDFLGVVGAGVAVGAFSLLVVPEEDSLVLLRLRGSLGASLAALRSGSVRDFSVDVALGFISKSNNISNCIFADKTHLNRKQKKSS